jgi:hypothetical protein
VPIAEIHEQWVNYCLMRYLNGSHKLRVLPIDTSLLDIWSDHPINYGFQFQLVALPALRVCSLRMVSGRYALWPAADLLHRLAIGQMNLGLW